ncbi:hypothetical protein GCM10027074_10230 [Streptomyces deserti]
MTYVILDGTLIESDRLTVVRENGNDLWFSRKHKAFGGRAVPVRSGRRPVVGLRRRARFPGLGGRAG